MKRMLTLALALLLCATALAETREAEIPMEGEMETIEETFWAGGMGFSFWYDADRFAVEEEETRVRVWPAESDLPVYMELLPSESVGMLPWQFLEANAPEGVEYAEDVTEDGSSLHWFSREDGGLVTMCFTVENDVDFLAGVGAWPVEAQEGWGRRFAGLISTISLSVPVLRAEWLEEGQAPGDLIVLDEGGADIALWASENVTAVEVLSLELTATGEGYSYATETLRERSALSTGEPLALRLAFPGDIPGYGVRFVDASGAVRQFAIAISGRDGSLVLEEF